MLILFCVLQYMEIKKHKTRFRALDKKHGKIYSHKRSNLFLNLFPFSRWVFMECLPTILFRNLLWNVIVLKNWKTFCNKFYKYSPIIKQHSFLTYYAIYNIFVGDLIRYSFLTTFFLLLLLMLLLCVCLISNANV